MDAGDLEELRSVENLEKEGMWWLNIRTFVGHLNSGVSRGKGGMSVRQVRPSDKPAIVKNRFPERILRTSGVG